MQRRILTAALLLGAACATTPKNETTETRERVINRSPFDVAYCFPGEGVEAPAHATEPSIVGALLTARPLVLGCLVDPANRLEGKETTVTLSTTVDAEGASHTVEGENLSAQGKDCITAMLAKAVRLPPVAEGGAPAKGEVQVVHEAGVSPSVTLGVNEPSDIIGAIRLAQQQWCDCYPDAAATPSSFRAQVEVAAGATQLTGVTLLEDGKEAAAEGTGGSQDPVAQCLAGKLAALEISPPTKPWKLPYHFEFTNSLSDEPAANASPSVQFDQLDSRRALAQARTAMVIGDGEVARNAYVAQVDRYRKSPKSVPVKALAAGCQRLIAADDAFIEALESQRAAEARVQALAVTQQEADPRWGEVVTRSSEVVTKTEADLVQAKAQRTSDEAACPKVRL